MKPEKLKETLLEIVNRIRQANISEKSDEPILPSDTIYRSKLSDICNSSDQCKTFLKILVDSHHLFSFQLVEADERLMISSIRGYVVAEHNAIHKLKDASARILERAYEHQFYNRKAASTIMREMIGDARKYNNTPFGKALNIAIMTEQYSHLLSADINQYTDTYKENRLNELIKLKGKEINPESASEEPAAAGDSFLEEPGQYSSSFSASDLRAINSPEAEQAVQMDLGGKWGEAVAKFGVEFLVRIHFRKYEFDKVRSLIKANRITMEKDLRYIRDTIRLMEGRTQIDPHLLRNAARMSELKRMAQMKLNAFHQGKLKSNGDY